jgi:hypothetical protein
LARSQLVSSRTRSPDFGEHWCLPAVAGGICFCLSPSSRLTTSHSPLITRHGSHCHPEPALREGSAFTVPPLPSSHSPLRSPNRLCSAVPLGRQPCPGFVFRRRLFLVGHPDRSGGISRSLFHSSLASRLSPLATASPRPWIRNSNPRPVILPPARRGLGEGGSAPRHSNAVIPNPVARLWRTSVPARRGGRDLLLPFLLLPFLLWR